MQITQIEPSITTDYNEKKTLFLMKIPTEFLFLTPEVSDLYAKMQQVNVSRSEILHVMSRMVRKIEEALSA